MSKSKRPVNKQDQLDIDKSLHSKRSKKKSLKFTPDKKPKYNNYNYYSEEE